MDGDVIRKRRLQQVLAKNKKLKELKDTLAIKEYYLQSARERLKGETGHRGYYQTREKILLNDTIQINRQIQIINETIKSLNNELLGKK